MKVAHLISSKNFAGIEQHVYELALKMSEEIEQVIICDKEIHANIQDVKKVCLNLGSRHSPINTYKLIRYLKSSNISLLHCHGAKASTIGKKIKFLSNIKIVSTIHGHKKNNNAFLDTDAVIGVNKKLIQGIPKSTYIPNWFNAVHTGKPSSRSGPIIAVGRLEQVKGFDQLIKSWINIEEKLEIIGSGPEEKNLRKLVSDTKLGERIDIITNMNYKSIEEKYKHASGLIISSITEGGPRVLLEAINHEIPVLGTKVGMVSELIADEFLSLPDNQGDLQELLEKMIPLLPQLNMKGLKAALIESYSIKSAAQKTKEIYLDLLNANS